jgi:polyisoprenoid-binding protein YceI
MKKSLAAAVAALPLAALAAPESFTIDPYHTFPYVDVMHLDTTMMRGRFDKTSGKMLLDIAARTGSVELVIDAASWSSGDHDKGARIRARDEHLRSPDFFNAVEYPRITFKGSAVKWNGDSPAQIDGQLTILGVTRPISLAVERWKCQPDPRTAGKRYMCGGNAISSFKRSEFGMKFGIPAVGDEAKLWLSVEAFRD